MDVNIDLISEQETLNRIEYYMENSVCAHCVGVNADKINLIRENPIIKDIVNSSEIINIDGQSMVLAGKFLGYDVPERVAGIDLFVSLLNLSNLRGYKIYFIGAKEDVLQGMVVNIKRNYENINIVGMKNGYFSEKEESDIIDDVKRTNPDLVFVGITSPKKELFIDKYYRQTTAVWLGVGGSFDVLSGKVKRAPLIYQKLGFEWLYRMCQEPRRLWKRYIFGNISFLFYVIKQKQL